jgi:hypothetical protein
MTQDLGVDRHLREPATKAARRPAKARAGVFDVLPVGSNFRAIRQYGWPGDKPSRQRTARQRSANVAVVECRLASEHREPVAALCRPRTETPGKPHRRACEESRRCGLRQLSAKFPRPGASLTFWQLVCSYGGGRFDLTLSCQLAREPNYGPRSCHFTGPAGTRSALENRPKGNVEGASSVRGASVLVIPFDRSRRLDLVTKH